MKKLVLVVALLSVIVLGYSQSSGDMRYDSGDIQYYNGSTWVTLSSTSSVDPETFGAATVKGSAEGKYVYTATGGTEAKILVDSLGVWFGHQALSLSNDTLELEGGGFVVLPEDVILNGLTKSNDTIKLGGAIHNNTLINADTTYNIKYEKLLPNGAMVRFEISNDLFEVGNKFGSPEIQIEGIGWQYFPNANDTLRWFFSKSSDDSLVGGGLQTTIGYIDLVDGIEHFYEVTDEKLNLFSGQDDNMSISEGVGMTLDDANDKLSIWHGHWSSPTDVIAVTKTGDIRFETPNVGKGKVWTSDASGNGDWESLDPTLATLTDSALVLIDLDGVDVAKVTLTDNRTLDAPTNAVDYKWYTLEIIQDGTGNRTLTWDSDWNFGTDGEPTLSTAAGAKDVIRFYYDGAEFIATYSLGY